ncbi:MAG: radical SAM protein [Candidatus Omnitrophica bacterium]|nr:radical SAM protein [Candidatus Omnitrophota bacterium]MDD5775396.1 radical SAM protein [Candidatus Omnitrophota bacterium]
MKRTYTDRIRLPDFPLWDKMQGARKLISLDLEITARCNNNCRHCYVNLPADDKQAQKKELSFAQIKNIADQAVSLGAVWCLITGGEPLLRKDFRDIYLYLKRKGLLVSVFTNATLVTAKHIQLFRCYPPRDIEVTVYGVTQTTYEKVTAKRGSFLAFMKGLEALNNAGLPVRYKAMALRSNVHELPQISAFCKERTKDYFRFDPLLHLRFDRDQKRNRMIRQERLSPQQIVAIERGDRERRLALEKGCDKLILPELAHVQCDHLFHCGTGKGSFYVSYDGFLKLCSSLSHPSCLYDLKKKPLKLALEDFIPRVRDMRSDRKEYLDKCRKCAIFNLCLWCPAHSYLENGHLDKPVEYFCKVAHARARSLRRAASGYAGRNSRV